MLGELTPLQIERLLQTENLGRIGLHAAGVTYVVPVTYVYDGGTIIGHTSVGLKTGMARENPNVCFEVEHVTNLANWQSVICQGRFSELTGEEAVTVMHRFVETMMPLMTSVTADPMHQHEGPSRPSVVWRIVPTTKTGRFERR